MASSHHTSWDEIKRARRMQDEGLWRSPFTPEQRVALVKRQARQDMHPYTCPNDGESLTPLDRWVCPNSCGYEQRWAQAEEL